MMNTKTIAAHSRRSRSSQKIQAAVELHNAQTNRLKAIDTQQITDHDLEVSDDTTPIARESTFHVGSGTFSVYPDDEEFDPNDDIDAHPHFNYHRVDHLPSHRDKEQQEQEDDEEEEDDEKRVEEDDGDLQQPLDAERTTQNIWLSLGMILRNRWKPGVLGLFLLSIFAVLQALKMTDYLEDTGTVRLWVLWLSLLLIMRILFRMLSFLIVRFIHKISTNHWIDYYVERLDVQLTPPLLCTFGYSVYEALLDKDILDDVDLEDENGYIIIRNILICLVILFWTLFVETILLKWMDIKFYFSRYEAKIKMIRRHNEWIRILLGGTQPIFNQNPLEFLHLKPDRKCEFKLEVLENEEDLTMWIEDDDNASMVELKTVLWSFNPKSQTAMVITDDELKRICRVFAKVVMHRVRTAVNVHHERQQQRQKHLAQIQNNNYLRRQMRRMKTQTMPSPEPVIDKVSDNRATTNKVMILDDFKTVFGPHRHRMAVKAFNKLNDTNTGRITLKQLQRRLYRFIRGLVYLKQTIDSYHDMLSNLDNTMSLMVVFLMIFVSLFIFNSLDFMENLTTYILLLGIVGVFAGNGFGSTFDSIYFVFVIAPYSIGDRVSIGGNAYQITQIKLSSTTARTGFGIVTYFKNPDLLNTMTTSNVIQNYTRSTSCTHDFSIYLDQDTTTVQLQELKQRFEEFCSTRMATDTHSVTFVCDGVDMECRLKIMIWVGTYISFADGTTRWRQHSEMQMQLRQIIQEMDIQFRKDEIKINGPDTESHKII